MSKRELYEARINSLKYEMPFIEEQIQSYENRIKRAVKSLKEGNEYYRHIGEILIDLETRFTGTGFIDNFSKSGFINSEIQVLKSKQKEIKEEKERYEQDIKDWEKLKRKAQRKLEDTKEGIKVIEYLILEANK